MKMLDVVKLMRLDKPVGIWLLLWPTWQTAFVVKDFSSMNWHVFFILTVGVVLMRSIGCVINDVCDINFDKHVIRTQNRPLVTQSIDKKHALAIVGLGLLVALVLVLQLPFKCLYLAIISLILVIVYPLSKRWFSCPQLFLALAFGLMPVLFTSAALHSDLLKLPFWFCLASTLWPIAYDNLYAIADKPDDIKLKLYSSAKLLGYYDWLGSVVCYIFWAIAWFIFAWQQQKIAIVVAIIISILILTPKLFCARNKNSLQCLKAFYCNSYIGAVLFFGLLI